MIEWGTLIKWSRVEDDGTVDTARPLHWDREMQVMGMEEIARGCVWQYKTAGGDGPVNVYARWGQRVAHVAGPLLYLLEDMAKSDTRPAYRAEAARIAAWIKGEGGEDE